MFANKIDLKFKTVATAFFLLLPVFCIYFLIGLSSGSLPYQLLRASGISSNAVFSAFCAVPLVALVTRLFAWKINRWLRHRVTPLGLLSLTFSCALFLVSLFTPSFLTFPLFLLSRLLLGFSEGLLVSELLARGLVRYGRNKTGYVMSLNGIAMYTALIGGASFGRSFIVNSQTGTVCLVSAVCPFIVWLLTRKGQGLSATPVGPENAPLGVLMKRWQMAAALFFSSLPFAVASSVLNSNVISSGLRTVAGAYALNISYVGVRIFAARWPDRYGSFSVIVFSLLIQLAGQVLLCARLPEEWLSIAYALIGGGYSLIIPAFAIEILKLSHQSATREGISKLLASFDAAFLFAIPIASATLKSLNSSDGAEFVLIFAVVSLPLYWILKRNKSGRS